jgi:uncharacterized protein YciI
LQEFVYIIRSNRADFLETMTDQESQVMERHFHYLKQQLAQEKLIIAGPCLDGAFGICIILAESREDAEKMVMNDPAVAEGVMTSELHPFRVSLLQGHS